MKQFLIALLLLTLIIGCAPKEEPVEQVVAPPQQSLEPTVEQSQPEPEDKSLFVGTWVSQYMAGGSDREMSAKEAKQVQSMLRAYTANLELREDGTYRLIALVGAIPIEDEWDTDGETIVLTSSGADDSKYSPGKPGVPNNEELVLTVAEDGTLIGPSPFKDGYGYMVFNKQ